MNPLDPISAYITNLESELVTARASVPVWVPIESAPKDGTRILAGTQGSAIHRQWWSRDRGCWMIDYADGPSWQPTHWLSFSTLPEVPPLPVETEEGDGFEEWEQTLGDGVCMGDKRQLMKVAWQAALRSKKLPLGSP